MVSGSIELDITEAPARALVLERLQQLPHDATFRQIVEEIRILEAVREGLQASREGKVIPHEDVEQRVRSWLTK